MAGGSCLLDLELEISYLLGKLVRFAQIRLFGVNYLRNIAFLIMLGKRLILFEIVRSVSSSSGGSGSNFVLRNHAFIPFLFVRAGGEASQPSGPSSLEAVLVRRLVLLSPSSSQSSAVIPFCALLSLDSGLKPVGVSVAGIDLELLLGSWRSVIVREFGLFRVFFLSHRARLEILVEAIISSKLRVGA